MLGFTTNQLVVLFLVLVLGWLLGLLSRSTKKWRRAYEAEVAAREEAAHADAAELADRDRQIAERDRRIAELERQTVTPAAVPSAVTPSTLDLRRDADRRDDLSLIHGVGVNGQDHLNDAGIHTYRQIRALTADEATALERRIDAPAGIIVRDQWREQAALLDEGKLDEHRRRFGA